MRTFALSIATLLLLLSVFNNGFSKKDNENPYGQKMPGKIPELYQPTFSFLAGLDVFDLVISSDHREICYTLKDTGRNEPLIFYTRMKKGAWKKPEIAYFVSDSGRGNIPGFSPDGKGFTYSHKGDFMKSNKKWNKWSMAEKLPEPVCSEYYECGFSFARSGAIYFGGNGRPEGKGHCDIYCSEWIRNAFLKPENLENINTSSSECTISVSPDEKYIIFTRYFVKDEHHGNDLMISFRTPDGIWIPAQKLGPTINSSGANFNPKISADGKFFFYISGSWNDSSNEMEINTYWVSTIVFDEMYDAMLHGLDK